MSSGWVTVHKIVNVPYDINIVGDNGKVGADNIAKNKVYSTT